MYGSDIKYLPRTIVNEDDLFGEDTLSTFDVAATIEAYLKTVDGFGGEGDYLSKFGYEIRDEVTFSIARRRFEEIKTEKLVSESGWNYLLESANTSAPLSNFLADVSSADTCNIMLEDGNGNNYTITSERPLEGDLIYFPLVRKVYEIKHVEHEEHFYQTGTLRTYELKCELFNYSSERFNTGNTEIDLVEDRYNTDARNFQFTLEDGTGVLLLENGDTLLQEYRIEDVQPSANNEYFQSNGDDYIDFSETNPFYTANY
jgi:hypothetical protein